MAERTARPTWRAARRRAGQAYTIGRQRLTRAPLSPVRFVIFGRGRSGSTTLVSLLDSVPGLRCEGEILNQPVLLPRSYVRARCALSGSPAYGCKVLSYQLMTVQPLRHREQFIRDLTGDGFQIIHLTRENLVEHAVSNLRARQFGFQRSASAGDGSGSLVIEPDALLAWIEASEAHAAFEAAALQGVDHLSLTYEQDLAFESLHRRTLLRTCEFLGLPTGSLPPARSAYTKASPRALRDSVANYDEIAERLEGTPYARFLA